MPSVRTLNSCVSICRRRMLYTHPLSERQTKNIQSLSILNLCSVDLCFDWNYAEHLCSFIFLRALQMFEYDEIMNCMNEHTQTTEWDRLALLDGWNEKDYIYESERRAVWRRRTKIIQFGPSIAVQISCGWIEERANEWWTRAHVILSLFSLFAYLMVLFFRSILSAFVHCWSVVVVIVVGMSWSLMKIRCVLCVCWRTAATRWSSLLE